MKEIKHIKFNNLLNFLALLLLYVSCNGLIAMEQDQKISLEKFVLSLHNLPGFFTLLPQELQHHCLSSYAMNDRQVWYPVKTITLFQEQMESTHFSHDSLKILYDSWDIT